MLVPSYEYASAPSSTFAYWSQFYNSAPQTAVMIANNGNGPGTGVDANYTTAITNARAKGVKVIGYVLTSLGGRSLAAVEADIDTWYSWYTVDGIMLDDAFYSSGNLSYYTSLFNYIRAKDASRNMVVINGAGLPSSESYMAICDSLSLFEGDYSTWLTQWNSNLPVWMYKYSPSKFWAIVHSVPDQTSMLNVLDTTRLSGANRVYVTDQLIGNAYSIPPSASFWNAAIAHLQVEGI